MSDEDLDIIIRFLEKQAPESLYINFFGGEPLLNKEIILRFLEYVYNSSQNLAFEYRGATITTNGYLLDKMFFDSAVSLGLKGFQITLDGPARIHDSMRTLKSGGETYEMIMSNIKMMLSSKEDFIITLRVNFDPQTFSQKMQKDFISELKMELGCDERVLIMVEPIQDWTGNFDSAFDSYKSTDMIKAGFEEIASSAGFNLQSTLVYSTEDPHACTSGKENSYVILPSENIDGIRGLPLNKCTICFEKEENKVGHICSDGELVTYDQNWNTWLFQSGDIQEKCFSCHYILDCHGFSCPLKNQIAGSIVCPPGVSSPEREAQRIVNFIENNE